MLEYGFTDLDNDFITIWSDYLLYGDKNRIMSKLTKLAEKGQINAVQSWYLLKKDADTNEVIENIVTNYDGSTFNELLALGNRAWANHKNDIVELYQQKQVANEKYEEEYWSKGYDNISDQTIYEKEKANESFNNHQYVAYITQSSHLCASNYQHNRRAFFAQRLIELWNGYPLIFPKYLTKTSTIKNIRKVLLKKYGTDPTNSQTQFALAKNIIFFKAPLKQKQFAIKILKELSERELTIDKKAIINQETAFNNHDLFRI